MKELEKAQYDNKKLWDDLNISDTNRERILEVSKIIPNDVNSLADLGCGNGLFLNYLNKKTGIKDLMGIDFSDVAIVDVKTKKIVGDITDIPLGNKSYDLVSALEVLEHLSILDFKRAKEELARVAKKYILISVPFEEDLELEFTRCPLCKTKFNISHHKRSFNRKHIHILFEKEGFKCSKIKYISKRNEYFVLSNIHNWYRKKKGVRKRSGVNCPVCGWKQFSRRKKNTKQKKGGSILSQLKMIWPKRYRYKWVSALYIKK
jgi:ubiquinone/menaquinone biosynthesis C-methylase UbiE